MFKRSLSRNHIGTILGILFVISFLWSDPAIAKTFSQPASIHVSTTSDGHASLQLNFALTDSPSDTVKNEIEKAIGGRPTERTYNDSNQDADDDSYTPDADDTPNPDSSPRKSLHFFFAEGHRIIPHTAFMVDGTIDLSAIFAALRDAGIQKVSVEMEHPTAAYNYAPPKNEVSSDLQGLARDFWVMYNVDLDHASGDQSKLRVAFGYKADSLAKRFGVLGLLFLLPIGMAVWRRFRISRSAADDPASVRYGAMRTINAVSLFIPITWYMLYSVSGSRAAVTFAMGGSNFGLRFSAVDLAILFAPPLFSIFVCTLLLSPLLKVEDTGRTKGRIFRQFSSRFLGSYLPWILVLAGIDAIANRQFTMLIGLVGAGQALRLISKSILARDASRSIYPLMGNSLRAKTLDLAARSGVVPREIYVRSEEADKSANACATPKKMIVLNEFLVKRFTRREVDAVVGHELGHLRLNHSMIKSMVLYGGIGAAIIGSQFIWAILGMFAIVFRPLLRLIPYLYSSNYSYYILIVIVLLILQFLSRRFEYSADSFAVTVTGDPEAMMTALAKLARLNLLPMSWAKFDEGIFTHPSTIRRIHAIARRSGIPEYRIDSIINAPDSPEDRYSLTDTALAPAQPLVFSGLGQAAPAPNAPPPGYSGQQPGGYLPPSPSYGNVPPPPGYATRMPSSPSAPPAYPSAPPTYPASDPAYTQPAQAYPPTTQYPPLGRGYPASSPDYAPTAPAYPPPVPNYPPPLPSYGGPMPRQTPMLGAKPKSGLKVLIPFKLALFTATASLLLLWPGTYTASFVRGLPVSPYVVALLVGLLTVVLESARIKSKLLKQQPKSIEFHPARPEGFNHLDTNALASYTAELERLGFQRIQDYTSKNNPSIQLAGFARFFVHPSHSCTAEVSQVLSANGPATKMGCTVSSLLDDHWRLSTRNREPNAYIYVKLGPKNLIRWLPSAPPTTLLEEHLKLRTEMVSTLGVNPVALTLESYLRQSGRSAIERRKRLEKTNIVLYLFRVDQFERNPKSEWLGDFAKFRKEQAKPGLFQYERAKSC